MAGRSGSNSPVDVMAGETFGKYVVIKRLAMGGMAEVCLAKLEGAAGFNKLVVVKQVLPSLASNPNFVEMFLDEGRLAARLTHANIAQTFELGEEAGRYFIAMEYVPGESLFGLIKRSREMGLPVPQSCVLRIVMQLLDALEYAHALRDERGALLNLVHRDVTPSNVMVTYHGGVKLLDFGIAKAVTQTHRTEAGRIKGKGGYMSPEQCRGTATLDGRADLYAVGSVLYQLVTGSRPFDYLSGGSDMLAVLQATMEGKFKRPSELRPDLSPEMERIILKAMAVDRDQRYPTAGHMLDDLERYASSAGVFPGPRELGDLMRRLFPERVELARSAELSGDAASAAALASTGEGEGRDTASPGLMVPTTGEDASPFLSSGAGRAQAGRSPVPTLMDSPASRERQDHRPSAPFPRTSPPGVRGPNAPGPAVGIPRVSEGGVRGPNAPGPAAGIPRVSEGGVRGPNAPGPAAGIPRVSQGGVRGPNAPGPAAGIPRVSQGGVRGPNAPGVAATAAPTGPLGPQPSRITEPPGVSAQPPRPPESAGVGLGSGPDVRTAVLPARPVLHTAGKSSRDLPMADDDEPQDEARTVIASEMQVAAQAPTRPALASLGPGAFTAEPMPTVTGSALRVSEVITSPTNPVLLDPADAAATGEVMGSQPDHTAIGAMVREEPSLLTASRLPGGLKPLHVVIAVGALCLVLIGMLLGWNARQEQAMTNRRGGPMRVPRTEAAPEAVPPEPTVQAPPAVAPPTVEDPPAVPAVDAPVVKAEPPPVPVEPPAPKAEPAPPKPTRATATKAAPGGTRRRSAPDARADAQGTGTLKLDAYPWAKVSWKGKELGVTPLNVELAPGDYELLFENPVIKVKRQVKLTVKARSVSTHFEKLAP